ncbi:MAG TPA: ABC transporter permease [Bryobacteraceae bacterium]|nr:ABC transporter permease [Bryobacteraceae bacterium]
MLSDLLFRLRALMRRDSVESELDEELRSHIEQQVEKHIRSGMAREEAIRQTRLQFGGLDQVKEDCRESRGVNFVETSFQDVRYALRQLRRTPGFTFTSVVTLALGIGANAAIFTLVNAMLLKSLPVADPKTLIRIGDAYQCCVNDGAVASGDYALFSTNTYEEFKKNTPEFEDLAAMQAGFAFFDPLSVRRVGGGGNLAHSSVGEFVSGNYFQTFGLKPEAGRLLIDTDDVKGASVVAVMSYEEWRKDYNGDYSVIGSTFSMNTKPVTVVGIAPKGFYGDRLTTAPPDFYLPMKQIATVEDAEYVDNPDSMWLYVMGRVKPGVNRLALQAKLSARLRHILASGKNFSTANDKPLLEKAHVILTDGGGGIQIMQLAYTSKLNLLMWISGLVLLIVCLNIANLLLVRHISRKAEVSIRAALGAGRVRIIRQLLAESIVLAFLGGTAALGVSYLATHMLLTLAFPGENNVPIQATPSITVVAFALAVSLVTGILFGVVPALIAAQFKPVDALRSGTRATVGGASLVQSGLIVLQTSLSLILLVGAGLFAASLDKLQNTDMKLESKNRYILHIDPQAAGYLPSQMEALYRTIEERFHEVSGVLKVGISTVTPMEAHNNDDPIQIEGRPDPHKMAAWNRVNAEYFDAVGTRVTMGRGIEPQDTPSRPMIAAVNQAFVKTFFKPGENPIGAHFGEPGSGPKDATIIGVVEDTVYTGVRMKNHPMFFVPILQRAASDKRPIDKVGALYAGTIVLETARPIRDMESIARKTLAAVNPDLTVVKFQTLDQQIADRFADQRMISRLMTLFGVLALLLATLGLYGVTSYAVARRSSEIGIRMALGSERGQVIAMILRGAIFQVVLGLMIGIPAALFCVRFVRSQLYQITNADANVIINALAALVIAACIAAFVPARRAAAIDPMQALRAE